MLCIMMKFPVLLCNNELICTDLMWWVFESLISFPQGDGMRDSQLDSESLPPVQLPPTKEGEDEFDYDCFDELMLEVPDCQLALHSKPSKRKLEETSELSANEFMSAGEQLPKRPHPEH